MMYLTYLGPDGLTEVVAAAAVPPAHEFPSLNIFATRTHPQLSVAARAPASLLAEQVLVSIGTEALQDKSG